jgi:hypothetical protein
MWLRLPGRTQPVRSSAGFWLCSTARRPERFPPMLQFDLTDNRNWDLSMVRGQSPDFRVRSLALDGIVHMAQSLSKPEGAVDTLHMTKAQWLEILTQLEREAMNLAAADRRREPRLRYRVMMGMLVDIIHPGGSRTTFLVRSRNLSRSGTGFLHGNFLHVGTRCNVTLPQLTGQRVEIGVKFDKPIALAEFLSEK